MGKQHEQNPAGPGISIIATSFGDSKPMPVDGVLQFQLDRYLVPLSVSRQSIQLQDAAGKPLETSLQPNIIYDPVARTITLTRPNAILATDGDAAASDAGDAGASALAVNASWLLPDQIYKVQFAGDGVRAIDGAKLRTDQPLLFAVRVGPAITNPTKVATLQASLGEPNGVSFCDDVLPIFAAKCATTGGCHGSGEPTQAAGLILDSSDGLAKTAKSGRAANGSNDGPTRGAPSEQPLFGHDMPIIEPGSPGNSWLMYKIDLAAPPVLQPFRPTTICGGPTGVPHEPKQVGDYALLAKVPLTPSATTADAERAVLSDYILGLEMPYPRPPSKTDYFSDPLTVQERETVRMWIARGANTPPCNGCDVGRIPLDAGP